MPPAARLSDMHTCPMVTVLVPHVGGPILPPCCPTVIIGGLPAARVGDMLTCVGPPDVIAKGSMTVVIGYMPAARIGDLTVHGGVIVKGCPTVIIGDVGGAGAGAIGGATGSFGPGPMSEAAAAQIFQAMASQPDIAFKFPADGCYARAHIMAKRMQALGATPGKAWTFAGAPTDPLWVSTQNDPRGKVEWGYHVAPTIPVRGNDGTVRDMVVDPSLFDHPVTVDEWKDAQHDHPIVVQTKVGQPPIPARGGSGYWPSSDPPDGPDDHAEETMERYKRCEGKDPDQCF